MTVPKVTILTVTYNHENFIAQALDGIVMQKTNFPFEVIIGDDRSTDNTAKIIEEYAQKYPEIIKPIYQTTNLGAEKNFFDIANRIKSKYVAYCDGDDFFTDPNKLQKQVDFLESHPGFTVCFHPVKIIFEDNSKPDQIFPSPKLRFHKKTLELKDLLKNNFIQTNSVIYRWLYTEDKKITDDFPEGLAPGDWFMHLLHAQKGKIGFIDEVMSVYRKHSNGTWWGSSNVENLNALYQQHGLNMLNFYYTVYQKFAKNENYYDKKVLSFAEIIFGLYLKNNNYEKITKTLKICPEVGDRIIQTNKKVKKLKKQRLVLACALILVSVILIISLIVKQYLQ